MARNDLSNVQTLQHGFSSYLTESVFTSSEERSLVDHILERSDACVFGGVVRDFILDQSQKSPHRDIDLVVREIDDQLIKYMTKYLVGLNRFGGYKLLINNKHYDVWSLNDTWALRRYGKSRNSLQILPATSFFNLNAIIFSLHQNRFFIHKKFRTSLECRLLDIVYEPNPCPELCIVKAYQFVCELNMNISERLELYIGHWFNEVRSKLTDVQITHYGKPRYCIDELEQFAFRCHGLRGH